LDSESHGVVGPLDKVHEGEYILLLDMGLGVVLETDCPFEELLGIPDSSTFAAGAALLLAGELKEVVRHMSS
jgi:hypothetical protein